MNNEIQKLKADLNRIIEIMKKDFYDRWYWYFLEEPKDGFLISEDLHNKAIKKVNKHWKKYCKENNIPI